MATIKSNTEELKMPYYTAYGTLFNATLDEYEANMRERFDYEVPLEDYIDECRYFEVNMKLTSDDDALEAIGKERNALEVSQFIMRMIEVLYDYDGSKPDVELGKLYTTWRYVVTDAVEWETEEEED